MEVEYRAFADKAACYDFLNDQLVPMLAQTDALCAGLANAAALLFLLLPQINWAGFYLLESDHLTLGPFQGRPAVPRIEVGTGVCGTAVEQQAAQVVPDVHACCNHIACDAASASEIVVPIRVNGSIFGVLDIDSPVRARFDEEDLAGLERFTARLAAFAQRCGAVQA